MNSKAAEAITFYHERTKHHFNRYAHGPGYMDWANQPNPFRRFFDAPLIYLPPVVEDDTPPYRDLFRPDFMPPATVSPRSLSRFFELSLAISAWKQAGDSRWALRSNPSSGNLHPTEGYLIISEVKGIHFRPGVFHYAPKEHGLELRSEFPLNLWEDLVVGFPEGIFFVGLSSIHWREAWKYGERAFRYCQHDIGHALAALRIAAQVLGWRLSLLENVSDEQIRQILGLHPSHGYQEAEIEHPDLIATVIPSNEHRSLPLYLNNRAIEKISKGNWYGKANRLSEDHVAWDVIDAVAEASIKPEVENKSCKLMKTCSGIDWGKVTETIKFQRITARQIVLKRRSAVAFDGMTSISDQEFYGMLSHLLAEPRHSVMPWDAVQWSSSIHLLLFVHRVRGLPSGLYFLVRNRDQEQTIRQAAHSEFIWQKPQDCPEVLNFYLLKEGDYQNLATQLSCNQEIAGQSAFSLGMIAYFAPNVEEPWGYRRLFWEAGMVGQMLYLAAEFFGVRSTGIGCYFDDPVHNILGLKDNTFQSLYHFTVGGSLEDKRLTTYVSYCWSCETPTGRYPSRVGPSAISSLKKKVKTLPDQAIVEFGGKPLSRIGAGLHGFAQNSKQGSQALCRIIKGPINILEVAPDETDGADEQMLGDFLNETLNQGQIDPGEIFLICQGGMIGGRNGRVVDGMKSRGIIFPDIETLDSGWRWCIHHEFLLDQLNRSIHRTGIGTIDLFLIRVPIEVIQLLGKGPCLDRIRSAFRFLQLQVDSGRIQAFGVVSQALILPEADSGSLSLESLLDLKCSGFKAVAFHGNFVDNAAFRLDSSGKNLINQARSQGILTILGSPLRSEIENPSLLLVDSSDLEAIEKNRLLLLKDAEALEAFIHNSSLLDDRTLGVALSQANIPSPFKLKVLAESFLESDIEFHQKLIELEEQIQRLQQLAETLGDKLFNSGLMEKEDFQGLMGEFDRFWIRVKKHCRDCFRSRIGDRIRGLRKRYFSNSPKNRSLVHLGIRWVLDQGVDIVLNHMRQFEYVEEAEQILESLGE